VKMLPIYRIRHFSMDTIYGGNRSQVHSPFIIFPIEDNKRDMTERFVPESFYGVSHIIDPAKDIRQMRDEWDRV